MNVILHYTSFEKELVEGLILKVSKDIDLDGATIEVRKSRKWLRGRCMPEQRKVTVWCYRDTPLTSFEFVLAHELRHLADSNRALRQAGHLRKAQKDADLFATEITGVLESTIQWEWKPKRTPNAVLDTKTGRIHRSRYKTGLVLARSAGLDPSDTHVWYKLQKAFPDRFIILDEKNNIQ